MFGEPIFLDMFCAHRNPPMTIVATTGGNGPALLDPYCFYLLTTIQPLPSPRATSTAIFCLDWKTDILAQEVTRGMREAASRGFWVSSHAPYGYNRVMVQDGPKKRPTLEINSDMSPIVNRMFDMAEAGNGTLEIIRTLVRGFQLRLNHQ